MRRPPRPSFSALLTFLYIWLMVGFSTGTSTLIGPVRWVVRLCRRLDSPALETAAVDAVILAFVLASACTAAWLSRLVLRTPLRHVRVGVPMLVTAAAGGALWLWMTPGSLETTGAEESAPGSHFTFGPYPTQDRLRALKRRGFTAVISLLHPAVVPFEPKLLADERRAAAQAGIELIHLPMLPWISENAEALATVREIARSRSGRYYVHCYLGFDRVQLVKRIVEQAEPTARTLSVGRSRSLRNKASFERGDIYVLEDDLFLTPYPTDEEFLAYVVSGSVRQVVALLDPDNPDDVPFIERERLLLSRHDLPFELIALSGDPYDAEKVLAAVRRVRTLPRPLVVHAFLSPSTGRAPVAEGFLQAFRSDLPPLPPALFKEELAGGPVRILAPNVAVGPRPQGPELGGYIHRRGVRELVFLGNADSAEAREDREIAREAGLRWHAAPQALPDLLERLGKGGPWYLYGPALAAAERRLVRQLGPAIPERTRVAAAGGATPRAGAVEFLRASLARALPDPKTVILLGPVLLLVAALAGQLVGWLRTSRNVRAPYTRKVFHFVIFTLAGVLQLSRGLEAVTLFGSIVSLAVLYSIFRGDGFPFYEALARPTDHPHRTLFVLVPLVTTALGGVLANLLFGPYAHVGYLVGGWGDAVGEPVGTAWGRRWYSVPSLGGVPARRSLEGSAAIALAGTAAAFVALLASGVPPSGALDVGIWCGLGCAAVEAVSHHGLDNLTVQVAAAGIAYGLMR